MRCSFAACAISMSDAMRVPSLFLPKAGFSKIAARRGLD